MILIDEEWIDCKELMPGKKYGKILVYTPKLGIRLVYCYEHAKCYMLGDDGEDYLFTHWRTLPEPPCNEPIPEEITNHYEEKLLGESLIAPMEKVWVDKEEAIKTYPDRSTDI